MSAPVRSLAAGPAHALSFVTVTVICGLAATADLSGGPDLPAGARALLVATVAVVVGQLAFGVRATVSEAPWRDLLAGSAGVGAGTGVALLLGGLADPLTIARVALGVAVLATTIEAGSRWLQSLGWPSPLALAAGLAVFAIMSLAPVWLGPLVELQASRPEVATVVVSLSPLSYLASVVPYDYLHGQWFYERSALGGLRFDYPSAWVASVVYLAMAAVLMGIRRRGS